MFKIRNKNSGKYFKGYYNVYNSKAHSNIPIETTYDNSLSFSCKIDCTNFAKRLGKNYEVVEC